MSDKKQFRLSFYGGAAHVTGANFLLERKSGSSSGYAVNKVLVDCGLVQGSIEDEEKNHEDFEYDPAGVDILFVTHAHLDHIGRVPKLVKDGFKGTIFSTEATKEIAQASLEDALGVMNHEERKTGIQPIYGAEDIEKAFSLWDTVDYYDEKEIDKDIHVTLKDAGHILGSAMIELRIGREKIVFTGDMGHSPTPLLRKTDTITDARYVVMEAVYGDRKHENVGQRSQKLKDAIKRTIEQKGTLMIPAFSIERTQVLLSEINDFIENEEIQPVPIFLDSPLAIKVTDVYQKHSDDFNESIKRQIESGDNVFDFPGLSLTATHDESVEINSIEPPKVVIAGSGMSEGGRILFHEKRYLSDTKNTLLIVGYQVPGTLGRKLQNGVNRVNILGDEIPVRATVDVIQGYSAHMDVDDLFKFAKNTAPEVDKIFVAMAEPKAGLFFTQRLRDYLEIDAIFPQKGQQFDIDFAI